MRESILTIDANNKKFTFDINRSNPYLWIKGATYSNGTSVDQNEWIHAEYSNRRKVSMSCHKWDSPAKNLFGVDEVFMEVNVNEMLLPITIRYSSFFLIENSTIKFDEHIRKEANAKILFSGRFGTGKSTYLKYVFSEGSLKDDYTPFYVNPVNYPIVSNVDIFKSIKVEILMQLLRQIDAEDFDVEDFNFLSELSLELYESPQKVFGQLFRLATEMGQNFPESSIKSVSASLNKIIELPTSFP
jgi:hypothetical protein